MKSNFILLVSSALIMSACSGSNTDKASVETGKADSLVRARLGQKEIELKRANDSIINAKALANADSIQKQEKEHGRVNTYDKQPVQTPEGQQRVSVTPTSHDAGKRQENMVQGVEQVDPAVRDHPRPNAAGGSGKSKPVKK